MFNFKGDTIRKLLEGGEDNPTNEEITAVLDAMGVPPLPTNLAAKAREMTEADLMAFSVEILVEQVTGLVGMAKSLQTRCGVCRDSGKTCAHCVADAHVLINTLAKLTGLTRVTIEATKPGTKLHDEREARRLAKDGLLN